MRGRNYPSIRQFTVFMENRVGQLLEVIRRFEGSKVKIVALSINDSAECAFVRFLLSHPEQGREILERAGLAMIESDLIGVELPTGHQPLLQVCTALLQAEVNIIQAYPLLVRPRGNPAVALMVDNIEMGLDTLASKGFNMITEGRSGQRRLSAYAGMLCPYRGDGRGSVEVGPDWSRSDAGLNSGESSYVDFGSVRILADPAAAGIAWRTPG